MVYRTEVCIENKKRGAKLRVFYMVIKAYLILKTIELMVRPAPSPGHLAFTLSK